MPSRPSRSEAPPPARQEQSPAKKFSFPFKKENWGARKIKIATKTFLRGTRAKRAAAERQSFRSKWVRAKFRIEHYAVLIFLPINSPPKNASITPNKKLTISGIKERCFYSYFWRKWSSFANKRVG